MISKWIEDLAADFWESVGEEEPFPRRLEHIIQCARPVRIVALADLTTSSLVAWLRRRSLRIKVNGPERGLNGCLVAQQGAATLFVEAGLDADNRRMIVAHEFGHYLAEYEYVRQRVARRLGARLLAVFDGQRRPTPAEQIEATLAGIDLGVHVHYMQRGPAGSYCEATDQVEQTANTLALELIAPWRVVLPRLRTTRNGVTEAQVGIELLRAEFGVPASWAQPYVAELQAYSRASRTFSESLGY